MEWIEQLKFDEKGLIPVITQDWASHEVLMLAYANRESMQKTVATGKVHYYSRSRQELWLKGGTSGHFQLVKNIYYDCDQDAVLIQVEQIGAACHTGNRSCFYTNVSENGEANAADWPSQNVLPRLSSLIRGRVANPKEGSYTNYLFEKGLDKMLKKVGEETAEVIIGAKNRDKEEITYEVSDLMYHLSVMMEETGVRWDDVFEELGKRHQ